MSKGGCSSSKVPKSKFSPIIYRSRTAGLDASALAKVIVAAFMFLII